MFGNLIFEGEYLNGLRNGKGKEYFKDNILRFEGDYLKIDNFKFNCLILLFKSNSY